MIKLIQIIKKLNGQLISILMDLILMLVMEFLFQIKLKSNGQLDLQSMEKQEKNIL